ncbi:MAG: 30S ribosomal protein S15 [Candidatus Sericytochromatia bacterium]|nr:30S ribosomal protein S15 [Candidatus Sericytochromatia bacterium]
MPLSTAAKAQVIGDFRTSETDTGSTQVQIALLSKRINQLSDHLKTHKKDFASRRGLLQLVGQRRGLLSYLQRTDLDAYRAILERLGLRK